MKLDMEDFRARFKIKRADHNRLMDIETEQIYEFKFHKLQQLTQEIDDKLAVNSTYHRLEFYDCKYDSMVCRCYKIKYIRTDNNHPSAHLIEHPPRGVWCCKMLCDVCMDKNIERLTIHDLSAIMVNAKLCFANRRQDLSQYLSDLMIYRVITKNCERQLAKIRRYV